ncbi:hypothetical protein [Kaistia sp. MMO-174]|uniref:hypothetical protein n=1 Tax=Kaistia sp. MMO-174 TaxID=3081256 RepID=UPI003017E039
MIQYLLWAPDRAAFLDAMAVYLNPVTGTPLATVEGGELIPSDCVRIDEIGPIYTATDGEEEPHVIAGWHVNLVAIGALANLLVAGRPAEGDVFARTRILDLLSNMEWVPISEIGVPQGWEGPSGVRIFDPAVVATPARVWA